MFLKWWWTGDHEKQVHSDTKRKNVRQIPNKFAWLPLCLISVAGTSRLCRGWIFVIEIGHCQIGTGSNHETVQITMDFL